MAEKVNVTLSVSDTLVREKLSFLEWQGGEGKHPYCSVVWT